MNTLINERVRIGTHSGSFHADDALATFFLTTLGKIFIIIYYYIITLYIYYYFNKL